MKIKVCSDNDLKKLVGGNWRSNTIKSSSNVIKCIFSSFKIC